MFKRILLTYNLTLIDDRGHEDEVTCIRWNQIADAWITGSDDGTVRIWNGTGNNGVRYVSSKFGAGFVKIMNLHTKVRLS